MKNAILTITLSMLLSLSAIAQGRYVTLKVEGWPQTNQVQIATNETVELVSSPSPYNSTPIEFDKDGTQFFFTVQAGPSYQTIKMAGPAVVRLVAPGAGGKFFCTLKITPDLFSPDKTIVIPAGASGATITMESSTDLLNWTTATNGFYSNTNLNMFFRIRADRAP